jgi:hypothetical protein
VKEPTYTDHHQIRGTELVVYKRKRSSVYQARLKVDGVKGYIVKTTGKKSLDDAIEQAEILWEDYRYRVRHNLDERVSVRRACVTKALTRAFLRNTLSDTF